MTLGIAGAIVLAVEIAASTTLAHASAHFRARNFSSLLLVSEGMSADAIHPVHPSARLDRHVLLLEPEEELQDLFSAILARDGYRLTSVPDGKAAVAALRARKYDAIIIDLSLGPSSLEQGERRGFGFLHYLERQSPAVLDRVILVSALVEREAQVNLPKVCSFLGKPFDVQELRTVLLHCSQLASS